MTRNNFAMRFSIGKLLESSPHALNLIFLAVMIGGSILILGSLYLIYDAQIFGERQSTKTDLMWVSITFTVIHIVLTNTILLILKKMRRAKLQSQSMQEKSIMIGNENSQLIDKVLETPPPILNLIFLAVMIGGSILILGSLYLIYDAQIFGERQSTKTDLMMISITFTIIHIILTNASLFAFKKMRYAKTLIQREKDELAKIDKAKDEFAAMIAHELKNPLVPIQSYTKMLLDGRFGELTSMQKEKMKIVISGTESMLFLIQDILDNHKAELGKLKLNFQSTDLNEIVNNAISITQPLAEKRGVTIYNDINKNIKIVVDKSRIEQVLINLIKNAIDFVPKETGMIKIGLKSEDHYAIVSISDNGCGISKEEISHLFGKFYQVNTSQVRERSGSGLGLAICKSIIDLHNGKIWAESDVGKGTAIKFMISLLSKDHIEMKRQNLVERML